MTKTPGKLKAYFHDPEHGWMKVLIKYDDEEIVTFYASYIYDSIADLIKSLMNLLKDSTKEIVAFNTEPVEYALVFTKIDSVIQLDIFEYGYRRQSEDFPKKLLTITGTYDQICLPFWRAIKDLTSRFSTDKIRECWRNDYSPELLQELTDEVKKRKKA